jgi:hypothetical protein
MTRASLNAAVLSAALLGAAGVALRGLAQPGFVGDGVGYYAPLASLAFEGNLDLRDELSHLSRAFLLAAFATPDGRLGDPFAVGSAIIWSPSVLIARRLPASAALDAPLRSRPMTIHPAFAPRFARAVFWTDAIAVLLAGALLAASLSPQVGATTAAFGVTAATLGTPTFFYVLMRPSYGHALSFAAAAVLLALAIRDRSRHLPLSLLGAAWGLVTLIRWQDAVLGLLIAPRLLEEWRSRRTVRGRAMLFLCFGAPAVVVFSPQMFFWSRIYGRPLLVPPGPDFLPLWKPQIVPLLLSTWNGAWIWSPLLLVGWLGVLLWPVRGLRWAAFASVSLEIYASAVIADWWGGNSFGARRLVSLAPLAALGIAQLLNHVRASRPRQVALTLLLALGCLWSTRLAQYWRDALLPANPGSASDYGRFYPPGSAHSYVYGWWDYPRLFSEVAQAERMRRLSTSQQR